MSLNIYIYHINNQLLKMTQPIGAFSDDKSKRGYKQVGKNFLIGGLSGMIATTFIQPADMLKTRI
tara:strand:+ start:37 stop:231 length:195 start_codon:yes stop_codon:yes gene_type:complete